MEQKRRKLIIGIGIAIYITALIAVGYMLAERLMVKKAAENCMETIKQGVDNETMDEVINGFVEAAIDNGTISSIITTLISGEDINDIYHALTRKMTYRITGVEKIGSGHYRIGILIGNINNLTVAKEAVERFKERYQGNIINKVDQALDDLNADKSQLISSLLNESSDAIDESENSFLKNITVDIVKKDDGFLPVFEENGKLSLVLSCAGIPYGSDSSYHVKDQIVIFTVIFICMILIPVFGLVWFFSKKKSTNQAVSGNYKNNYQISDNNITENNSENVAVLRAMSPQHNNIPFAVHTAPVYIGRDVSTCTVVFQNKTGGVSNQHCSVSYDNERKMFVLTDLRSTYGTFLNDGTRLISNKPYYLKSGEGFYIGERGNSFVVELQ